MSRLEHFNVGDHVRWNSEAGPVSVRIVDVHVAEFDYKDHRVSPANPQYEIKCDRTDHIAAHDCTALTKSE